MSCLTSQIRAAVVAAEPLLGYYLVRSKIVDSPNLPGEAAIDADHSQLTLHLNPRLFGSCDIKTQIGIILHEYLHALLLHCDKRALAGGDDAWIANVAQDMAINPAILIHYKLPKDSVFPDSGGYDLPYHRMSEFYFAELAKDRERFSATFGQPPKKSPQLFDCLETLTQDFERVGGRQVSHSQLLGSTDPLLLQVHQMRSRLAWQTALRGFARQAASTERTGGGRRYSRRLGQPYPGTTTKQQPYLAVILDTSASMKDRLIEALEEICSLLGKAAIKIYQCDNQLRTVSALKPRQTLEIVGFGGTDLQPAVDQCRADGCKKILIVSDRKFERKLNLRQMRALWLDVADQIKLVEE